jgi:hypothetical protein
MIRHLVESGAEINARNEAGETALFAAARCNHWHTTLYLLLVPTMHAHTHTHTHHRIRTEPRRTLTYFTVGVLQSGADAHATNKAGECVLMASSALCAGVIHDFVTRPRSLEFIAGRLLPLLCPGIDVASLITAKLSKASDIQSSAATASASAVGAEDSVSLSPPADQMIIEVSSGQEEQLQSLSTSFPEIVTGTAASPAATKEDASDDTDGDDRMALETAPTTKATTRTAHDERRQQRQAVARVTALLERVLEALQLYHGAPAETDPIVPRSDNEEDRETDRRVRWERNESLVKLKSQLTGWLKASKARIPRITRNLSFSTLSESEMGLFLRQWKALQLLKQQQQQQKQKQQGAEERGDGRKRKSALLPHSKSPG